MRGNGLVAHPVELPAAEDRARRAGEAWAEIAALPSCWRGERTRVDQGLAAPTAGLVDR